MIKDKRNIIIISAIIALILITSIIIAVVFSYDARNKKNNNQSIYIVIKQYEVADDHFKVGDEGKVIYRALFTDDLYYEKKIETAYGFNTILIKNGVAKVIDADCTEPYSINGCMSHVITNDQRLFDVSLIRCMKHGIAISWEVE